MDGQDFREVIWGMEGEIRWKSMLPENGLEGLDVKGKWTRDGDRLIGEEGRVMFGGADWKHYEIDVHAQVLKGGNIQITFRDSPDGCYMLDFLGGWRAVSLTKNDKKLGGRGFHKFSVVDWDVRGDREYHIRICAREASITTYIDGTLAHQVSDYDFTQGKFSFTIWQGKVAYRNPRARRL